MSSIKPILLALVLCDFTIREAVTNKLSLIGTFNGLYSSNFPIVHPSLSVYIALTDGHGRVPCKLRMISSQNELVFDLPGHIDFGSPASVGEMVFQLQQIRFDTPGVYAIEFWAGGDLLGSRKLSAQRLETPPVS